MFLKRPLDFFFSLIAFIISLPAFAVIAVLIRIDSPGPVFFKQKRSGFKGRVFWIYKFRTMVEGAEKLGPLITAHEDPRITQIGRILRWFKLDELPQLLNVLKGDMSLVGPRPEVPSIVEA